MDDLISRQMAIDEIENAFDRETLLNRFVRKIAISAVRMLPSAQPMRKKGKWIAVTEDGDVYKRICSCCGQEAFFQNDDPDELYYELSDFCPHCGAKMEVSE